MPEEEPQLLLEDEAILVVNKPAGLRTIRDGYNPDLPHLAGLLQAQYGRVWTVHRLDKDTSGVMVFARSAEAHRALNQQFSGRGVRKVYHALVSGVPEWAEHLANAPLRVDGDRRHRTVVDALRGKPAETELRVLAAFPAVALIEACPHTGYTHQIRAHLSTLGFPLLADDLYNPRSNADIITRTALHAVQISFTHPASAAAVTIQAEYPPDFAAAMDRLRTTHLR